jgi:gas vesicle protein
MGYLDKDELLERLGLETTRPTGRTVGSAVAVFGVGLLVGAGIALLLAPTSGLQLRADLGARLDGDTGHDHDYQPGRDGQAKASVEHRAV